MAHTIFNTVKKELDKRGKTAYWLEKKMRSKRKKGKKICDRTLAYILNNKKQDVRIDQLILIAEVFEEDEITGLQWYHMIENDKATDMDRLAGTMINNLYLKYSDGGISRKSAHERAIEDCVELFKNWNK